ncbi:MAG: acetolactate synthase large subunit [Bauldia sp.]|nr:acetolactate synthase large subunit [Bauldia sp.]
MNGAESLARTLLACGVDTCFANPGTSEMHFVAALDRVPGIRCVLALFEGVATGAADGYARMAGKPAATLLHCGPGLANGLANLHNARRARVPLVNIVGDQATYHAPLDPPLAAETAAWARPVSAWLRTASQPEAVGEAAAEAVRAASTPPGGIATLILPSDASWGEGGVAQGPLRVPAPATVADAAIAETARLLRSGDAMLFLGGDALRAQPLAAAHRIAAATGARLMAETFSARMERGHGRFAIDRLPYNIGPGLAALAGVRHLVLVGADDPVAFFAYPGQPGRFAHPETAVTALSRPGEDGADALARLAERLGAPDIAPPMDGPPAPASGAVTQQALGETLAALLPEQAVVVEEGITFAFGLYAPMATAAPHDYLRHVGGAIGVGLPLATGAAVGAPGRRVVSIQADGSALYTVQALWTQARERLDVTTVMLSNRRYAILDHELAAVGAAPGPASRTLFDLGNPDLDWVRIAGGFGVEAARAETMESFADLFAAANRRPGPFLIELVIP